MAGFYIDIRSIDEYARYLSKYVTNLADLVVAMKADTLKTEEQWKDKIYQKTLDTIIEMEKIFKVFDDEVKRMIKTLKVMGEKFSDYVD